MATEAYEVVGALREMLQSEERREELSKVAAQYAESSKVVIRNIRREFLDSKKNQKKNSEISEDELKKSSNEIQKNMEKNILPTKKDMIKQISDIIKFQNP